MVDLGNVLVEMFNLFNGVVWIVIFEFVRSLIIGMFYGIVVLIFVFFLLLGRVSICISFLLIIGEIED